MDYADYVSENNTYTIIGPPKPKWQVNIGNGALCFSYHGDLPPNGFHRYMSKVLCGISWTRIKGE